MKVVVPRDVAAPALATAIRSMAKKADVPILGDLLLSAHGDHLTITATDLDRRISISLLAEVIDPGEICIEGKTLAEAIKRWPEGEKVTVETIDDGARCTVACGRSRIRIGALPASDFPQLEPGEIDIAFAMEGAEVAKNLELCLPHAADDIVRYYLNGVAVGEDSQGDLVFVATNGHTLARVSVDMPDDAGGLSLQIIPSASATEIARIAKEVNGDDVEIEFSESTVSVRAGDTRYLSKLIDGTFPAYETIIPTTFFASATVNAKALARAVERAAVVLRGEATGIALEISGEAIRITARLADAEAESEADAVYDAAPRQIGLNADYLRTILKPLGDGEAILSLQEDGASAVVVTSEATSRVTQVIMPVRLTI